MDEKQLEIRNRLYNDFSLYARHVLKIRTKDGEIKPFVINKAQEILLEAINKQMESEGKVRVILLKARQTGLSTFVGGWLYWWISQHKAQKGLVITHHADSTRALFDLTKRYYDNTPEIVKPKSKYSSRKELQFDLLDSSYVVATAGGDAIARGQTFTHAHLSELAFWPSVNARENLNGILQAVPNSKGSAIFIESTANGIAGPYYEIWKGAVEGTNGYIPVFIPWNLMDEYREPIANPLQHTPEELDLIKKFDLDDEQLQFRRKKVATNGLDLFRQEYPITPEEAFLTTGRPVFNLEKCQASLEKAPDIKQRLALENEEWVDHPRGELLVYRQHDPGEAYTIGCDIAMGVRGGDYTVAQVLDSKRRQVAMFRAHVHPDYAATVIYHLGMFYNTAFIAVERNNHGILTCTRLGSDMAYPNFYLETSVDKLTEKETITLGFSTNVKTKPLIIDQLRAAQRENKIEVNDKTTIREMMTYVVTESGSMEAEPSCHDDTVMALAIANHVCQSSFTPVEVTDDFYIEVI